MPAVTILSPYSGKPVKVREQDLGRAIRDEQGRVFYIVEHPEHGRYAARTRKGSDKDLERYRAVEAGTAELDEAPAAQAARAAEVYDATGTKRRNPVGLAILLVVLALLAAGAYVYFVNPGLIGLDDEPGPADPSPRQTPDTQSGARHDRGVTLLRASNRAPESYRDFRHLASGLRYKTTHRGEGPLARASSVVTVRYTAQSLDGEPIIDDAMQSFVMSSGEAIRAFDEGLAGRRQGVQMKLLVPRGHSTTGRLVGAERLPRGPYLLDVQVVSVRPGVSWVVEERGEVDQPPVAPGDTVTIHYVLRVEGRSEVVDATSARGEPVVFTVGAGEVIRGLDLGLVGMHPDESRTLTVPPYLAYGEHEVAGGLIPADAVLSFRVFLARVERAE